MHAWFVCFLVDMILVKESFNLVFMKCITRSRKCEIMSLIVVQYVPNCPNRYSSALMTVSPVLPIYEGSPSPLPGRRLYTRPSSSPPQHSRSLLTAWPPQHCWPWLSRSLPAQHIWFPEVEYGILPQQASPMPVETRLCGSSGQHTSPANLGQ